MNIGLFTSVYFNNIGNGFIDIGAEEALKRAIPKYANLIKVSQCANFAASMSKTFAIKENPLVNWIWVHTMQKYAKNLHDKTYKTVSTLDVMSVPRLLVLDYLIIPGCVLTVPFFTIFGKLLQDKVNEGCKLVFLGASGNFYTDYEIKIVSKWLQELKPYAILTRDSVAYENYKMFTDNAYNGIDNVLFVNLLNLPKIDTFPEKYSVINIEEPKHKRLKREIEKRLIKEGENIVYTNHKPYPRVSKMVKNGIIVSDYPLDYLLVYRNASKVYSDRVHACIPTLSFGNKAILYSDSPRKSLFKNVKIVNDRDGGMTIKDLEIDQTNQINYLRGILRE